MNFFSLKLKKNILFSFLLTIILFGANKYAILNNLYFEGDTIDILTHFLGGFVSIFIVLTFSNSNFWKWNKIKIIFITLIIGILWEAFEIVFNITNFNNLGYNFDTASDLVFDIFGGISAFIIFRKIK